MNGTKINGNIHTSSKKKKNKNETKSNSNNSINSTSKHDYNTNYTLAISYIVNELLACYESGTNCNLTKVKGDASKKFQLQGIPKMADIIQGIPLAVRPALSPLLQTKPVRTASGVAVVAVMSKPHRCPHIAYTGGVCVYCPGGLDSDFEYSTQAYTGYEPTSMRAIRARYDPYSQVLGRVNQLKAIGHTVDKVEFIVMGGTFLSLDKSYKDYFIRNLHDALSGYNGSTSIAESIRYSEQAKTKCIGITIETRPDYCLKPHLEEMLSYGCTRIEIGVQSIYENIARETNRGHTIKAVCHSFDLAKDCGYKIVTHMMPDLPNCTYERDLLQFQEYFENPKFRTDGMKLYPTLVIRGTGLYELWKLGKYRNYTPTQLIDLVANILALVPPWTRLYRIQRDIPMPLVSSGVEHGNLRELALYKLQYDWNISCLDIRTREVGMKQIHNQITPTEIELIRRDYVAQNGWETFLSFEDPKQDILVGLLRLRKIGFTTTTTTVTMDDDDDDDNEEGNFHDGKKRNNKITATTTTNTTNHAWIPELTECSCSIIRELHVYGTAVGVYTKSDNPTKFQHQGYGILLMEEAERIAKEEHNSDKLLVISGVGTRHYYRKFGYTLDGYYMSKMLKEE